MTSKDAKLLRRYAYFQFEVAKRKAALTHGEQAIKLVAEQHRKGVATHSEGYKKLRAHFDSLDKRGRIAFRKVIKRQMGRGVDDYLKNHAL